MGLVTNMQRFSTGDGKGIRTSIFLKGCALNCAWCHNPETISPLNEILYSSNECIFCRECERVCKTKSHVFKGNSHIYVKETCLYCFTCAKTCPTKAITIVAKEMMAKEVIGEVKKDIAFFGKDGGLTLSGGEPLYQADFALEILRLAKKEGINTYLETSGFFDSSYIKDLVKVTDVFLYDLKDGNKHRHIEYTGADYDLILKNLYLIDKLGGKTILRCLMVNTINTDKEHLDFLVKTYKELDNVLYLDLLSYHPYGASKREALGYIANGNRDWQVGKEEMEEIKKYLEEKGVTVNFEMGKSC